MTYEQLNLAERKLIKKKIVLGKSLREIAKELDRSVSTISTELQRNKGR